MLFQSYFLLRIWVRLVACLLDLLLLLHNSPSFKRPLHFLEKLLVPFLCFISKIVKANIDSLAANAWSEFCNYPTNSICRIAIGSASNFFVYSNKLIQVYNYFLRIHNPTNILQYNLCHFLLTFLFLRRVLYQQWLVGHKSFFHWWWRYNFYTAQKMKFSIKDFFSKCDQIRRKLRIWSH